LHQIHLQPSNHGSHRPAYTVIDGAQQLQDPLFLQLCQTLPQLFPPNGLPRSQYCNLFGRKEEAGQR
jgi:hypothetical protein